MKRILCIALAACASGIASGIASGAEPPRPDAFAYGLRIDSEAGAPIYRLPLTEAVYLGVVRPDLGDLRVFNAAGEPVPHAFQTPAGPVGAHTWTSVPLFPLAAGAAQQQMSVQVRTDSRGAVVEVAPASERPEKEPATYLLDLSQLKAPARRLRLHWQAPAEGFSATLGISASNDLNHWRPLTEATVAELSYGEHRLRRDEIELPDSAAYLRLSGLSAAQLRKAEVELEQAGVAAKWQWRELAGSVDKDGDLIFDSQARLPVEQLQLGFAESNQLLEARLESGPSDSGPWRPRSQGLYYRLTIDGAELANEPALIQPSSDRYWRLRSAGDGLRGVRLLLGWRPQELVFVSRGEGPFLLAYGSGRIAPADSAVPELLRDLKSKQGLIRPARIGEAVSLAGAAALEPPPKPLPWRQWALWSVLILAVAVLGFMALRLVRELNRPQDPKA